MSTKAPKDLIGELERINADLKRISKMTDATKNMIVSTVNALHEVYKIADEMRKNIRHGWNGLPFVEEKDVEQSKVKELDEMCSLIDKAVVELNRECEVLEENLIK
tara:strand:- start:162 stop:479 length:318 start_codon:yes stop_codon:yes gene_type:complete